MKILTLILFVLLSGCIQADEKEETPFLQLITAINTNDQELFRSVYSEKIRKSGEYSDWSKNFSEAKINVHKIFGDPIDPEEFTFKVEGNKLRVTFKGERVRSFRIVKEKNSWKLDQR